MPFEDFDLSSFCEDSEYARAAYVEPPFACDYGTNISLGAGAFVNVNAVFLDCAPITIGARARVFDIKWEAALERLAPVELPAAQQTIGQG